MTTEDWKGFCNHAEKFEKDHWEKDGVVPYVFDQITININGESNSDSATNESSEQSKARNVSMNIHPIYLLTPTHSHPGPETLRLNIVLLPKTNNYT
ncbi:hypothetical protein C0J52_20926 [Blattella germanica]|nr:hypothetical protein C0J52_20926 [Blattella germanica]